MSIDTLLKSGAIDRNSCPTSERLVDCIIAAGNVDFDEGTMFTAKTFLADTLAVGVAGTVNPASEKLFDAVSHWNESGDCRILGRPGVRMSAQSAAVINGFQIHCLEWDALHEPSVVIALCTTTAALISEAECTASSMDDIVKALIIGVETAVFFGAGATTEPRFFRPSAAGLMGASMALGYLRGYSRSQMLDLLGLAYSQVAGTMQAHWEGSEALPLQIGLAARSALTAVDLVAAGISGPHDVIDGKFGYFRLIEQADSLDAQFEQWAQPWKVKEVAHKPFPAGRATQATLTAIMDVCDSEQLDLDMIETITVHVPSLIMLLVGRPYDRDMSPAYARLCLQFIAPMMIREGRIDPRRFTAGIMNSEQVAADARKVTIILDGNPDPNALSPQRIEILFKDGRRIERVIDAPFGSPDFPMSRTDQLAKAAFCFEVAGFADKSGALFDKIFRSSHDFPMKDVLDIVSGSREPRV
ncbi:MAG: MmgE/PrpD family protein [Parasphingorhabdus sp.]|uniref:MmgE/PrpD family protein n=1 Tax=Parasphingorhabdus sp. TaxID=2709688 RepID=UPI00329A148E